MAQKESHLQPISELEILNDIKNEETWTKCRSNQIEREGSKTLGKTAAQIDDTISIKDFSVQVRTAQRWNKPCNERRCCCWAQVNCDHKFLSLVFRW